MRLLADESLHGAIVNGLRRARPSLDLVRVQDVGLAATADPDVLAWAAAEGRVVVTQDRATLPDFASERVVAKQRMPGALVVRGELAIGRAIEELLIVIECSSDEELEGQVMYLPL